MTEPVKPLEVRIDVACKCGAWISLHPDDDGSIVFRCGTCDRYIFEGTMALQIIIREPTAEEDAP
jgi:hypothetical protein